VMTNLLLPHLLQIQPRLRTCQSSRPPIALTKCGYLLPYFHLVLSEGDSVLLSPLAAPAEVLIKILRAKEAKGKTGETNPHFR